MADLLGQSAVSLMNKRMSVRTYSKHAVEEEKLKKLSAFISDNAGSPFGSEVKLIILKGEETPRLGTYGFIRGARDFIAGSVKKGGRDIESFGFELERAILYATALDLGTCWIGGFFTRGSFSDALELKEDEFLPAVCPFGYRADKRSIMDKFITSGAGSRNRFPFEELFFDGEWGKPLKAEGDLKTCLEMVRIAPSASNKQPWRVIKKDNELHFYQKINEKYAGNTMFGFCMQRLDLGIAACHFEFAAREFGIPGAIVFEDPKLIPENEGISYSFTWL